MAGWRYAAASVVGSAHVRTATPCQDHHAVAADGPNLAAIVCDGAGSAAKAAEGARTACLRFLDLVRTAPTDGEADPALWAAEALAEVQDTLARTAAAAGDPAEAYACTLLAASATANGAVFLQVGDGAIAYRAEPAGPWRLATRPRRGEFANETTFITAQHPGRHASVVRISGGVQAFALMSDGVEFLAIHQARLEPHGAFFGHVLAGMRAGEGEDEAHSRWVAGFLASDAVNQRTDDDKTLVLATRAP